MPGCLDWAKSFDSSIDHLHTVSICTGCCQARLKTMRIFFQNVSDEKKGDSIHSAGNVTVYVFEKDQNRFKLSYDVYSYY